MAETDQWVKKVVNRMTSTWLAKGEIKRIHTALKNQRDNFVYYNEALQTEAVEEARMPHAEEIVGLYNSAIEFVAECITEEVDLSKSLTLEGLFKHIDAISNNTIDPVVATAIKDGMKANCERVYHGLPSEGRAA